MNLKQQKTDKMAEVSGKDLLNFKAVINPLSASPTKWSNTLKQFVGKLPPNCLSVFVHFVGLALKGLRMLYVKDSQIKMAWNEN